MYHSVVIAGHMLRDWGGGGGGLGGGGGALVN